MNFRSLVASGGILIGISSAAAIARGGNNEMTGFRYQSCEGTKCVVVSAPKAWISQANGAFIATGISDSSAAPLVRNAVTFQLVESGKVKREFKGDEVANQPEVQSMTVESSTSVVLYDTATQTFEVIAKPQIEVRGAK